jgi:hypothetical protein
MPRPAQVRDLTFVALLLTVLLAGCSAPWPFPQPTPDLKLPDSQQIFRPLESAYDDVNSLDPLYSLSGVDYEVAQLIFPQLVTLDENLKPIDWAATSSSEDAVRKARSTAPTHCADNRSSRQIR